MIEKLIKERILDALPEAEVEVSCPDGVHCEVLVRAKQFQGLKRLEQHRLVMNAVQTELNQNTIHALGVKTEVIHG